MDNKSPLSKNPQFFIQYIENLLNWELWVDKADKLLEASKILEPQIRDYWNVVMNNAKEGRYNKGGEPPHIPPSNIQDPYFILISYALENLLKALIIRDRSDEIRSRFTQTGKLPKLIRDHDLLELSRKASIKMDIKEEDILTRLSRFSKWKSRYPVPVELSDLQNVLKYSDGKAYFTDYSKPDDLEQLDTIIKRVKDHLKVTR